MAFCDFVVKYDPAVDTADDLADRILYTLFIKRIKGKKPAVAFVGGESGEGKSYGVLRLMQILCRLQGFELRDHVDDVNVYTPIEYPEKLDRLLHEPELKKVNMIAIHEAREVVKAKLWQSFLTQAIADINAMSRSIKRLMIFIVSQFIRDITTDIRYTLNYYVVVRRPIGKRARLYFNVLWKDDRDLESPKLRKRKISGYLVYPDGKYRRFVPQYFEIGKPDKDIISVFEKRDYEAKSAIIKSKVNRLVKEMKSDMDVVSRKVDAIVEFYGRNPESLNLICKRYRGKWKLKPEVKSMHDLGKEEFIALQEAVDNKLNKVGLVL